MIGCLDHHFVGADSGHLVEEAFAGRFEVALDPERGKLVRHDAIRPARAVGLPARASLGENLGRRLGLMALAE